MKSGGEGVLWRLSGWRGTAAVVVGGGGCGLRVARIAVPVAVDVGIWGLTANYLFLLF